MTTPTITQILRASVKKNKSIQPATGGQSRAEWTHLEKQKETTSSLVGRSQQRRLPSIPATEFCPRPPHRAEAAEGPAQQAVLVKGPAAACVRIEISLISSCVFRDSCTRNSVQSVSTSRRVTSNLVENMLYDKL